jgi:hypothetical protein
LSKIETDGFRRQPASAFSDFILSFAIKYLSYTYNYIKTISQSSWPAASSREPRPPSAVRRKNEREIKIRFKLNCELEITARCCLLSRNFDKKNNKKMPQCTARDDDAQQLSAVALSRDCCCAYYCINGCCLLLAVLCVLPSASRLLLTPAH